jgi:regulation of enolase protein 1 (concanavalin A-like superfamily)
MNSISRPAVIGILFLGAGSAAFADDKPRVIFAEKFSVPLETGWSWLREEPKAWKVEDGALHILALPGHLYAKHNDARNVLLRKAPETAKPLAIEVYVESRPKLLFEEAAMYWYYDDDNYISVVQEQVGKEVNVRMIREKAGAPASLLNKKYEAEGVWLRLVVSAGKATGYYRQTDKDQWEKMGQADLPSKGEAKVGLNAAGGPKDTDRWARFRDFRILELAE